MNKPAENNYPIHNLLKERWSPRAYSSQPVELEKLLSLFEAARWSPSAANAQPWSFIVVTPQDEPVHSQVVEALMGMNKAWAGNAPVLVIAVAKTASQWPGGERYAYYDLGQAVAHLSVQAGDLGLHVHQMAGFDAAQIRQLFELGEDYTPLTMFTIGYFGNVESLPEDLRTREVAPRTRKPLSEFVFKAAWNQPLTEDSRELTASRD